MNFKKKDWQEPSRNWMVVIYTKFINEFSKDFILSWAFLTKRYPKVTFVSYRIFEGDLGLCLEAYVEFSSKVDYYEIEKIFSFEDTFNRFEIIKEDFAEFLIGLLNIDKYGKLLGWYALGFPRFKNARFKFKNFPEDWRKILVLENMLDFYESI